MKKVIIFAGTKEGRILSSFLAKNKIPVTACVATEYGGLCLNSITNLNIKDGRLTEQEIEEAIADYDYVIDATHPYARVITENIKAAAQSQKKNYLRIVRPTSGECDVIECENMLQASEYLNQVSGNVLITTGSKELEPYTKVAGYKERLYVRVLPTSESLEACISHGFEHSRIICMQGPFSEDLNIAMLKQINARYLVTKESGKNGGFDEKISAATKCGVKVIVIGRPVKEEGLTLEEVITFIKEEYKIQDFEGYHFPMFMNLENRKIIVIGAGNIAARRIETLLNFRANIKVIAPEIHSAIQARKNDLEIIQKEYDENDINGAFFVVAATNNRAVNQKVYEDAVRRNILVNVADQKEQSDFYFPAVFSDDKILGGMISKDGSDHRLVKKTAESIRNFLQERSKR